MRLIAVGKLKEPFYRDACAEYEKRLTRYEKIEITELPDLKEPAGAGEVLIRRLIEEEGKAILKALKPSDYVVALCVEGRMIGSEALADFLSERRQKGDSVAFLIGGSNGLSDEVKGRADLKLSFSKMTFPHQLARVILLEQVYRAQKINANERYHK